MAEKQATLKDLIDVVRESAEKDEKKYQADLKLDELQKKIASIQTNYYTQSSAATKQLGVAFDRLTDIYENNNGIVKENARKQIEALESVVEAQQRAAEAGSSLDASEMGKVVEQLGEFANLSQKEGEERLRVIELDRKLKDLQENYFADADGAKSMRAEFDRLIEITQTGDENQQRLANQQLASLESVVGTEEDAAEKKKAAADQQNSLLKLANGLEGLEKTLDSAFSGAGKAAFGIGALALLFKPELFISGVLKVVEFVRGGIEAINAIIEGDWGTAFDFISENFLAVAGVLTFFAVKFGVISALATGFRKAVDLWRWATMSLQSGLLRSAIDFGKKALVGGWNLITKAWTIAQMALKSNLMQQAVALLKTAAGAAARGVMTAIAMLGPALASVGVFMTGTALPAIGAALAVAGAAIAPILVAAAPFIAIGAGIVAAFFALKEQFTRILDIWDSSDSILEALFKIAVDIITAPVRWIKNLFAWVLDMFGFEDTAQALSDFSITDFIYDSLMSLGNAVMDWATSLVPDWLLDWLGIETKPEKPEPKEADVPTTQVYTPGERDQKYFDSGVSAQELFDNDLRAKQPSDIPSAPTIETVENEVVEYDFSNPDVVDQYVRDKYGIGTVSELTDMLSSDEGIERNTGQQPVDQIKEVATPDFTSLFEGMPDQTVQTIEKPINQEPLQQPQITEDVTSGIKNTIERSLGLSLDDISFESFEDAISKVSLPSFELPSFDDVMNFTGLEMPSQIDLPFDLGSFDLGNISMPDIDMTSIAELGINKVTDVVDQLIDKVSAISPIRDTQVENNELRDIKESNTNLIIQQNSMGKSGGGGGGSASVSSQQVNVTNNVDIDRHSKMFTYSIAP